METLLGIDIGTTHCKVGLFQTDGASLYSVTHATVYEAEALWALVRTAIAEVVQKVAPDAIGITSMAETGLLVSRHTGAARSPLLAWHDRRAEAQAVRIAQNSDARARFVRSGLRINAKAGLAKLLWLCEQGTDFSDTVWLSAADFIAQRLTGAFATAPTLAARTFAYDIATGMWDAEWLAQWGLETTLFPAVLPAGKAVGATHVTISGLPLETPVAIAGHDHVCAALAAGAVEPGMVFDSMGTAETLVGALKARALDDRDFASGFLYGPHIAPERLFWMSSLPASGGSVEWLRDILGAPRLAYEQLAALLEDADPEPTGILYYPYLSGSGAPHANSAARAAFIGLRADHTRAHLAKAILEGVAYEMNYIRRAAQDALGLEISAWVVAGGGTKNPHWLQIKADISGCPVRVFPQSEAALWGAAALTGVQSGLLSGVPLLSGGREFTPDAERHALYRKLDEAYRLKMDNG